MPGYPDFIAKTVEKKDEKSRHKAINALENTRTMKRTTVNKGFHQSKPVLRIRIRDSVPF
jgi:hypothetical protein